MAMKTNKNILRASKLAVVCYGLGDLASQFVWTYVGSYLTIFYTDIVGLAPIAVSGIMIVARIWDAVNDPVMGMIAERTRTRWGRFRPWIAMGCPLLAVFSVMTFINYGNGTRGIFISGVIYIITGMLYTMVNIPYSSLAAVMTEDSEQRNLISISRGIGMNLGCIIVNACSAGLALHFSGNGAEVATGRGYMITAMVYAVISIPLFMAVFLTSRELIMPEKQTAKINPGETFQSMLSNKYLVIMFVVATIQMLAFMGRISITTYYVIYCLGAFTLLSLILTIPSIGGVIGCSIIALLARNFDKKNILIGSFLGQAAGLLIIYFAPFDNLVMIIIGHCVFGVCNCGFPICIAMVADCVDYWEDMTGMRQDGSYYAIYGLSTKFGTAIGSAFGVLLISSMGYVAGNMNQTMAARNGINLAVNLIPAVLLIVAALIIWKFWDKSDKDFDTIRAHVKDHRESGVS